MQPEHAILILFPTIWPLAGLKYDSINYCQESPGAKPFSRRRFGGAPGVPMELFSPRAVGFGDVAQPHPIPAPVLALQGRASPQLLLGTSFGAFFWHFQPCRRREGCCLMQRAAGCSPGTRVRHHLDNDRRQPRLQNGIFPAWEDPWSSHGACTCPSPLPASLGAASSAPGG